MMFLYGAALWLLPLAVLGGVVFHLTLKKAWDRTKHWEPETKPRGLVLRPLLTGLMIFLVIVAAARPVWDPEPVTTTAPGQSVVFVVDVSRSMAAGDLAPSRLEAVKKALLTLIPQMGGDEGALIAFSGSPLVRSPLTQDRLFLSQNLEALEPGMISRGGTKIADALEAAHRNFGKNGRRLSIWLFTDGGDQRSDLEKVSGLLKTSRHRLFIKGVGTPEGAPVPDRPVESQLMEELLWDLASWVPDSAYLGNDLSTLSQEYRTHRKEVPRIESTSKIYQEGAWYLMIPLTLLIFAEFLLGLPARRRRR